MQTPMLNEQQLIQNIKNQSNPFFTDYFAFYSSWFGGITTNPRFMLLPMDDHMVHRGDGVFEAMKVVQGTFYMLDEHLDRLFQSAAVIELSVPFTKEAMRQIILDTFKAANQANAFIRIFLSRGPGNYSVNPYDAVGAQFYVVVTKLKLLAEDKYDKGVNIGKSAVAVKTSWMSQVKSCNYLPNVMMKKESVDRQLDFVISIDEYGSIAEGATENILIVDKDNTIIHPDIKNILKGITMTRVCELAKNEGIEIKVQPVTEEMLKSAKEVIITGTTLDVVPVVEFEGHKINDGKPGPLAKKLRQLIQIDINKSSL